ncbi:MAG: 50S ribosomal protein L13 [Planctomycetota bacterium]
MKSFCAKPGTVTQHWRVVDASGQVLGRLASRVAVVLMGKHRPTYTPHVDTGDYVIVVNAAKVRITGRKLDQRLVRHHTGYMGHLKEVPLRELFEKHPEQVVELAVRRMLPKTKLGRDMLRKLKIYRGPDHPHQAQTPEPLVLES